MNLNAFSPHLSDDKLIARLYGLETDANAHLEACGECAERWDAVQNRRASVAASSNPPSGALALQRRRILARIENASPVWTRPWVWVSALAAALLIAIGFAVYQPGEAALSASPPVVLEPAEADWIEDAYSPQPVEPRAAGPLRELFEEEVATE